MKTKAEFKNRWQRWFKRHLALCVGGLLLALSATLQAQFTYTTNNGTITIMGYTGPSGAVTIPSTINGLPVTSIGDLAFYDGYGNQPYYLTSVTIPNSVTSIGGGAFAWSGLSSATLGNGIRSIGEGAFADCGLITITIPSRVTSIGDDAFAYCSSLTGVFFQGNAPSLGGPSVFIGDNNFVYYLSGTTGWGPTFGGRPTAPWDPQVPWICTTNNSTITIIRYIGPGGAVIIPSMIDGLPVTSLGDDSFLNCTSLTGVTIGNNVTSIGESAFEFCSSLTSVTIGSGVTNIGSFAFYDCISLTSVTIPNSVTSIGHQAFDCCGGLTSVYFKGNAPSADATVFISDNNATVYYLPGTTGWGPTFGGRPTVLWILPTIQTSPQTQTAEAGSAVGLRVEASGSLPMFYLWYLNSTNLLSCSTNCELELTNLGFPQSGAYTVVISNVLGTATSAPALLQVIPPVERRPVPGVKVTGETGSLLNVDYANSLNPAPNWTTLSSVSLTNTSQYCFDLTAPLPPQRFYRAWQTGTPSVVPSLSLSFVPAITLTGNVGDALRLDYINAIGPTNAWVTLATVTLTNTSQHYFDSSALNQPTRVYRIVPVP